MNQILVNILSSLVGIVFGTAIGLGLAYCASRIFGWDFKKIFTPKLILIIIGTVVAYSVLQNFLKAYGVSDKTLIIFNAAIAFFGLLFITIFCRKKNNKQ